MKASVRCECQYNNEVVVTYMATLLGAIIILVQRYFIMKYEIRLKVTLLNKT